MIPNPEWMVFTYYSRIPDCNKLTMIACLLSRKDAAALWDRLPSDSKDGFSSRQAEPDDFEADGWFMRSKDEFIIAPTAGVD
jgi:hypothetical protein